MSLPPLFDECKYCHHNRAEHDSESGKFCSSELRKEDFDRGRVGKFCGCTHFVKIEPTHIMKEYHPPQLLQLRLEKRVVEAATKWFEVEDFFKYAKEYVEYVKEKEKEISLDSEKDFLIKEIGDYTVLLLKRE